MIPELLLLGILPAKDCQSCLLPDKESNKGDYFNLSQLKQQKSKKGDNHLFQILACFPQIFPIFLTVGHSFQRHLFIYYLSPMSKVERNRATIKIILTGY